MGNPFLAKWEFQSVADSTSKIIPDGCRDLILWSRPGQKPKWSITALDCSPHHARIETGTCLYGFRLHPGTNVRGEDLLKSVAHLEANTQKILNHLDSYCTLSPTIAEAISCIGDPDTKSVRGAAKQLGVNIRTLQRLIGVSTGLNPARWLGLARARRAARLVGQSNGLAETAYDCGYSDQAHMSREFSRWFETSPSKIGGQSNIQQQLSQPGYY